MTIQEQKTPITERVLNDSWTTLRREAGLTIGRLSLNFDEGVEFLQGIEAGLLAMVLLKRPNASQSLAGSMYFAEVPMISPARISEMLAASSDRNPGDRCNIGVTTFRDLLTLADQWFKSEESPLKDEVAGIDAVMARRPAVENYKTRVEKVRAAFRMAEKADALERRIGGMKTQRCADLEMISDLGAKVEELNEERARQGREIKMLRNVLAVLQPKGVRSDAPQAATPPIDAIRDAQQKIYEAMGIPAWFFGTDPKPDAAPADERTDPSPETKHRHDCAYVACEGAAPCTCKSLVDAEEKVKVEERNRVAIIADNAQAKALDGTLAREGRSQDYVSGVIQCAAVIGSEIRFGKDDPEILRTSTQWLSDQVETYRDRAKAAEAALAAMRPKMHDVEVIELKGTVQASLADRVANLERFGMAVLDSWGVQMIERFDNLETLMREHPGPIHGDGLRAEYQARADERVAILDCLRGVQFGFVSAPRTESMWDLCQWLFDRVWTMEPQAVADVVRSMVSNAGSKPMRAAQAQTYELRSQDQDGSRQ